MGVLASAFLDEFALASELAHLYLLLGFLLLFLVNLFAIFSGHFGAVSDKLELSLWWLILVCKR